MSFSSLEWPQIWVEKFKLAPYSNPKLAFKPSVSIYFRILQRLLKIIHRLVQISYLQINTAKAQGVFGAYNLDTI
jgi:hypothetical protein